MTTNSETDAAARERLSALVDGELEDRAVAQACAHWRESPESRATWHSYQLIGDVLRSDDLAADAAREARFLVALRERLATEPVVLAPQPVAASRPGIHAEAARAASASTRRWSWMAPTAVAAGFVAVAGVLTLTRTSDVMAPARPAAASLAQATPALADPVLARSTLAGPSLSSVPELQTLVANGDLIRDARLDRYLAAHKQFAGSTALGVPSGFLRNATAEAVGR
ncbi:MAG TPA: sigma-E factor negative regulatory protein [Burkholderiaceae bacterium]|nr:sigma-E factor negative regulatory protein [Burkholderiaceae bacterium]